MKMPLFILTFLFCVQLVRAEARSMLVEFMQAQDGTSTVNIYSDVDSEGRRNISISDACSVLKNAEQPRDTIFVFISAPKGISGSAWIPIIKTISDNYALKLCYIKTDFPSDAAEALMQQAKQTTK